VFLVIKTDLLSANRATSNQAPTAGDEAARVTTASTPMQTIFMEYVETNTALWYKIHVFVYDLRNFDEIPMAQARLNRIVDASYIGMPYFCPDEVVTLKNTIVGGEKTLEAAIEETLNEQLERRIKKRVESDFQPLQKRHPTSLQTSLMFSINGNQLLYKRRLTSSRNGVQSPSRFSANNTLRAMILLAEEVAGSK
jgi:hypothetical protein